MSAKMGFLLRKPDFRLDSAAAPLGGYAGSQYLPYTSAQPFGPIKSPGLDLPFLYHSGTVRGLQPSFDPPERDQSMGGSGVVLAYAPPNSSWGKKGGLLRAPRTVVVISGIAFDQATGAATLASFAAAARGVGASAVVIKEGFALSPLVGWCPPRLGRSSIGSVINDLIAPESYLAGDVLVVVCRGDPYFGGFAIEAEGNLTGYEVHPAGSHGIAIGIDRQAITASRAAFPGVAARCGRFSGLFLYDPSPNLASDPPSIFDLTLGELEAAYGSSSLWADFTAGLPWTRQAVGGSQNDPAACGSAIAAAIGDFWPRPH